MFFKKTVTFLITFAMGLFSFCYYFMPHKSVVVVWDAVSDWAIIIAGSALLIGAYSMIRQYWGKAKDKEDTNRWYAWLTLITMFGTIIIGFATGIKPGSLFNDIFMNIMVPLEATMFSLLAFYIASAAFRSFRLKNFSAALLLFSAIIVMLGQIPVGENIYSNIPVISQWILDYPNVAAQRAILIGISIGAAATAIKIILGIDKSIFRGVG